MVRSFFRSAVCNGPARLLVLASLLVLSGCGFALRGSQPMPLDTLYIGVPDNTRFGADLRRALAASSPNTRQVDNAKDAQASLIEVSNTRRERDVSLNPDGRIEEYELSIRYVFRLVDARGRVILPDTTLTALQDMPYDDQILQAKDREALMLFMSMEKSLIARIVRRLTAPDVTLAIENLRNDPDADTGAILPPPATQPALPGPPNEPSLGSRPNRL